MSIYMPHINSLQSTMWSGTLVYIHLTLLAYASEQIFLQHCTYVPIALVLLPTYRPHISTHKTKKNKKMLLLFTILQQQVLATYMPLKWHIYRLVHVEIWGKYINICASYDLTITNSVTGSTGIHTFHIIGICLWRNMPATLCINVSLHCY